MPKLTGKTSDVVATPRPPGQVRAAQLVVASHVPAAELREVLQALGICNRERKIEDVRAKRPIGTRRPSGAERRKIERKRET